MIHIALFEPEIPQNTGTLIRYAACMDIKIHIIEPCGFIFSDKNLLRAGMDYIDIAAVERHESWNEFLLNTIDLRHILIDPQGPKPFHKFQFLSNDILILGKESSGFPQSIKQQIDPHIKIPMKTGVRSLNVAIAGAVVATEALKQTGALLS